MQPHVVIAVNRSHVRFLEESLPPGATTPRLVALETFELPDAKPYPAARAAMHADESPHGGKGEHLGLPERLPFGRDQESHVSHDIASRVNAFLLQHPDVRWRLVASPDLYNGVLDFIASPLKERFISEEETSHAAGFGGREGGYHAGV